METYLYSANINTDYQKDTGCTGLWGGGCGCPGKVNRSPSISDTAANKYTKPASRVAEQGLVSIVNK